ncbi:unnamed protein product [Peniophora sp. CBMAI 1063]|nr:unnamed protein product [Peniophora sp. CBMAI 1063]
MCQNIISGRFHSACGHFEPMSTSRQDCMRPDCIFSARHEHPGGQRYAPAPRAPVVDVRSGCKCARMMAQPIRNPIRVSPARCANCLERDRVV